MVKIFVRHMSFSCFVLLCLLEIPATVSALTVKWIPFPSSSANRIVVDVFDVGVVKKIKNIKNVFGGRCMNDVFVLKSLFEVAYDR
jgi:hypothetical protein